MGALGLDVKGGATCPVLMQEQLHPILLVPSQQSAPTAPTLQVIPFNRNLLLIPQIGATDIFVVA
jgi:hypothetical protein